MANLGELTLTLRADDTQLLRDVDNAVKKIQQGLSTKTTIKLGLDDSEIRAALSQTSTIQKQVARESVKTERQANEEKRAERQRYLNFWKQSLADQDAAEKAARAAEKQAAKEAAALARQAAQEKKQAAREAAEAAKQAARDATTADRQTAQGLQEAARQARDAARQAAAEERAARAAQRQADREAAAAAKQAAADKKAADQSYVNSWKTNLAEQVRQEREAAQKRIEAAEQVRLKLIQVQNAYLASLRTANGEGERVTAAVKFRQALDGVEQELKQVQQQAGMTNRELLALERIQGQIDRNRLNSRGVVNPIGMSGTLATGLDSAAIGRFKNSITELTPLLGTLSPSLGAAAMNGSALMGAFRGMAGAGVALNPVLIGLTAVTAGFALAVLPAVDAYADLEKALNSLKATSGANAQEMKVLREQAENTGKQYGLLTREVVAAQEELAKGGVKTADIAGGATEAITVLAKATGITIKEAVDIAVPAMNVWSMSGAQMMKVADVISNGANKTALDVAGLAMSLQQVANSASTAGISLTDTIALLGMLADRGMRGSDAGTSLRVMLQRLTSGMPDVIAAVKSLNVSIYDNAGNGRDMVQVIGEIITALDKKTKQQRDSILYELAGADASRTLAAAWQTGTKGLEQYRKEMEDTGTALNTAKTRMEDLRGAQDKMKSSWDSLRSSIGEFFAPMATAAIEWMTKVINKADELLERFTKIRNAGKTASDLGVARSDLQRQEARLAQLTKTLNDPNTSARDLAIARRDITEVSADVVRLRAEVARLSKDNLKNNLENGVIPGPNTGKGISGASASAPIGWQNVVSLLGMAGRNTGTPYGGTYFGNQIHNGEDIFAPTGTNILAPFTGYVSTRWSKTTGNIIEMIDAQGQKILLGHLDKYADGLEKAVRAAGGKLLVQQGQVLGTVGQTGTLAHKDLGPKNAHTHLMTYLPDGTPVDPKAVKFVSMSDADAMTRVNGSYDSAKSGGTGGANSVKSFDAYLKEAQRITELVKKYSADGSAPDFKKWTLATAELKKFGDQNEIAAAAVQYAQAQIKSADKEVSKLGQTYDRLKDQMDIASAMQDQGQDVTRQLKAIASEADKAAQAELARNSKNSEKYQALLKLSGDASQKLRTIQDKADREAETAAANRLKTQQDLQAALSKGQEQQAQALLSRLKAQQAKELDLARNSAKKRAEIVAQSGPAIIAAEDKLAQIKRERAVKAAQEEANRAKALPGADLAAVEATRVAAVRQAYATEKQERDKARSDQAQAQRQANQTALQAQQQHEKERKKLIAQAAQEARELRYQESDATLNRIKSNNKAELDAFTGSVDERLELIKRQSQAEYEAAEVVARIKRDNALRDSANKGGTNQAARDARIKQDYTDYVEGLKNTRIATVREATKAADDFWKAAQKDADQYKDTADHFTRMAAGARSAGGAVDGFVLSIEDAVNGLPEATDAQADYLAGLKLLEQNGTAAAGAVAAVTEAIEQKAKAERQALQDASDLDMLSIFGGGEAGLKRVFDAFGVSGIDQLKLIDPEAAAQVERVFKSTLAQMQADLEKQAEAGRAVLENFKADADALADETQRNSDQAVEDKNALDAARVKQMAQSGPDTLFNFLNKPGRDFGDSYWTNLGEFGREKFMEAFNAFTPEDFNALGEEAITAMLEKIPDDPAWEGIRSKLAAALDFAVSTRQEVDTLLADIQAHPELYGDGGKDQRPSTPREKVNVYNDQMAQVYEMDRNGDLFDPVKVKAYTEALGTLAEQGDLTAVELQVLLDTIKQLQDGVEEGSNKPLSLSEWQDQVKLLTEQFDAGEISAQDYSEGLKGMAAELEEYAKKADAAGNPQLAQAFRNIAKGLKEMTPEAAEAAKKMEKLQSYGQMLGEVLSAASRFAEAMGEGEKEYDETGKALNTPWKDLAANIAGAEKAVQLFMGVAKDLAQGNYFAAIMKVVNALIDALSGFKKAYAEAQRLRDDFADANPLLNASDFQKVSVQSRGLLADIFVGPKVVNEIDKIGLKFAQTVAGAVTNGFTSGLQKALETGNFADFAKTMSESLSGAVKQSMIDAAMAGLKVTYADVIKEFSDAMKSGDPDRIARASEALSNAYKSNVATSRTLFDQLDAIDKKNQTGRWSPENVAKTEMESLNRVQAAGLLDSQQYAQRKYEIEMARIRKQRDLELATAGLTADEIAAINQRANEEELAATMELERQKAEYRLRLAGMRAETVDAADEALWRSGEMTWATHNEVMLHATLARIERERQAALNAANLTAEEIAAINAKFDQQRMDALNQQRDTLLNNWAGAAGSALVQALESQDPTKLGENVRKQVLRGAATGLIEGLAGDVMRTALKPLADEVAAAFLTSGTEDDIAALSNLRGGLELTLPKLDTIYSTFQPLYASFGFMNEALAKNAEETKKNTEATKENTEQMTQKLDVIVTQSALPVGLTLAGSGNAYTDGFL